MRQIVIRESRDLIAQQRLKDMTGTILEDWLKTPRPVSYVKTFVPRMHGRSFIWHVREARRIGALSHAFRERDIRMACPGWAWRTYFKYPDRHPDLFVRARGRHYSLVEEQVSPGGCIRSR